jgi:uncharacterized protein YjiS (DUF1127 family)
MHSLQSFYDVHGISTRATTRSPLRWVRHLAAMLPRLKLALKAELEVRRAAAELAGMDDHMLRDIGIHRSEIERVVRGSPTASGNQSGQQQIFGA